MDKVPVTRAGQVSVQQLQLLFEADDLLPLAAALCHLLLQLLCRTRHQ